MQTFKTEKPKPSETEQAVNTYLHSIKVNYAANSAGIGLVRDGWECDGWAITFSRLSTKESKAGWHTVAETFNYYTGIGHRYIPLVYGVRELMKEKSTFARNQLKAMAKPSQPFAASVLHSLIMDSSAKDENFNDWCSNFGYDSDSIKALNIYKACLDNAEKLNKVFTREEIENLQNLLQDY